MKERKKESWNEIPVEICIMSNEGNRSVYISTELRLVHVLKYLSSQNKSSNCSSQNKSSNCRLKNIFHIKIKIEWSWG